MPPSQLKRLKASLREEGITGPQKSKKQKKNQKTNADQHARKAAVLASIREASNPFDFKTLARPRKFEYTTNRPQDAKNVLGRPGVTKSLGEETRRKTLLPEMNRRNKVGGILDRRIGEDDPGMSLDDRMMARFEREQQRKRGNVFDLEEADDDVELTHGGRALQFDIDGQEDYDAASVDGSSIGEDESDRRKRRKGDGLEEAEYGEDEEDRPERKKSKREVMEEVIAKSKQYKYERQQQKEDDDELRETLDKDLPDILTALLGNATKRQSESEPLKNTMQDDFGINPERAALLAGKPRDDVEKEYDTRVRQMLYEQRSKPTERTKTEEEKAREEATRLKELEERRIRRMRGEQESESEHDNQVQVDDEEEDQESTGDDAAEFGLSAALASTRPEGIEDEDDFLQDDLIASDSEADMSVEYETMDEVDDTMAAGDDEDFLKHVIPDKPKLEGVAEGVLTIGRSPNKLAFTYTCPQSHLELLRVFKEVSYEDTPAVIQRIRALYHAGLHADNKNKLTNFACALVDHISHLSNQSPAVPLSVVEKVIRHIHSLSKSYPIPIGNHFRQYLKSFTTYSDFAPGDLTILTAIGTIYPTSDHFHQVVTPAITIMTRWLGLTSPASVKDIATGAYICSLCISYQRLSKRYIPEIIRYTTLCLKSPHMTPFFASCNVRNILKLADLWSSTPAFPEVFTSLIAPLSALIPPQTSAIQRLMILLQHARLSRRPQQLHHHRPLPIKSSVPKFEEAFDPNKHYDPDRDRAEANKLRKEYKREKQGAMRELRKDASFIAREKLKEKRERDRRYEEKYKRLVAEIQGEEGREKNVYEREKRARKRRS